MGEWDRADGGEQRCFVVTWEPHRDPGFLMDDEWDSLAADAIEAEGGLPLVAWPVPTDWAEVSIGDVVYVFRPAVDGHGIVARGEVRSEPYREWGRAVVDLAMRCVPLADAVPVETAERAAPSIEWRLLDADGVREVVGDDRGRLDALWPRHVRG